MEWEQIEESWRDLKSRVKSRFGESPTLEELGVPLPRKRHHGRSPLTLMRDEQDGWRELEASVFEGDIDGLLRDFEASGCHH